MPDKGIEATVSYMRKLSRAQGISIDPKRHLVIASNANWTRATQGPELDAREALYKQVQALIDTEN